MRGALPTVTPANTHLGQQCQSRTSQSNPWLDGTSAHSPTLTFDHQPSLASLGSSIGPEQTTILVRTATTANCPLSTRRTSESSPSVHSSSSSSSLSGGATGEERTANSHFQSVISAYHAHHRSRPSELLQHIQTSKMDNDQFLAETEPTSTCKRRCISASPVVQARTRWTSPDRFISQRPSDRVASPFRLSKPPDKLRGRELYQRIRDPTVDPFRSLGESRSQEMSRRTASTSYGLRPPRYLPSFAHGDDAGPVNLDPRRGPGAIRHPSWTGFWNIGATGNAHFGQMRGIPTGRGRRLASGTNAPMHTTAFLDEPTGDQQLLAQASRLALALDIDLASRVLRPARPATATISGIRDSFATDWRDGAWMKHYSQKGKLSLCITRAVLTYHSAHPEDNGPGQKRESNTDCSFSSARCTTSQR